MRVRRPVRTQVRKSVIGARRALVLGAVGATVISIAPVGQARAANAESAVIVGRVTFRDKAHQAKAEDVERLRWGRLIVEMRRGWDVYAANLDANGFFSISGPPGTYRLDYVRLGQLTEFVVPHQVKARAGHVTCLGTLEITVVDLGRDLGNNSGSQMQVRDDCAAMEPEVQRLGNADAEITRSVAKPVANHWNGPTALEIAAGLRAELVANQSATVRGSLVVPISRDTGYGNFVAAARVLHLSADFENKILSDSDTGTNVTGASAKWGGSVGAGYSIWLIEALVHGGFLAGDGPGEHGPMLGASLRLGTFLFGIGVDVERYPSANRQLALLTLDLAPIGLIGSLL